MSSQRPDFEGLNLKSDDWISNLTGMRALVSTGEDLGDNRELNYVSRRRIFVTAKVPTEQVGRSSSLLRRGFVVVDTALSFEWTSARIAGASSQKQLLKSSHPFHVREAEDGDADAVAALAGRALIGSRFHLDPDFPDAQAIRIKTEWARNLALGRRGHGCLIAISKGLVVGFLGFLKCDIGVSSFVIDLVGVDPEAQGNGVGKSLVSHLLRDAANVGRAVTVGTQAGNVQAVRLYEGLGFHYTGATQVLHAHDLREQTG